MGWFILAITPWRGLMEKTSITLLNEPDELRFCFYQR